MQPTYRQDGGEIREIGKEEKIIDRKIDDSIFLFQKVFHPVPFQMSSFHSQVTDENGCVAELLDIEVELIGNVQADAGLDLIQCEGEALVTLSGLNTGGSTQGWYDLDGNLLTEDDDYLIDPSAGD